MATRSDEKTADRRGARRRSAGGGTSAGASSILGATHPSRLAGLAPHETHLRPFTQTAETPAVAGARAGFDPRFAATGMVPAYAVRVRRRSPLWFRLTLWTMLILIAAAASLIGVHHFRPGALRAIESASAAGPRSTGSGTAAGSHQSSSSTSAPNVSNGTTVELVTDGATGTATVPASQFDVVIATQGLCWVSVTDPGSTIPVFSQTLPAGAQQVFPASNGGLVVNVGSSHVTLSVQIKGKTVAGSDFTPTAAPFTLTYSSSS